MIPERRICSLDDLERFKASETYANLTSYIEELNEMVKGYEIGLPEPLSPAVTKLLHMLDSVADIVALHPPMQSQSRFGKVEFRDFYDDVARQIAQWIRDFGIGDADLVDELAVYLRESWGNRERIDYGSGHELNFMCFIYGLSRIGVVHIEDYRNIALGVFDRYLKTMRKIQKTYWLEPAGSHGVWGLDDYHFLPFLFGSGQLVSHKYLRPISIHDKDLVEMYADAYYYFGCIKFINDVKTVSLRWHSPMLDDISGVKRWSKVNEGMIKMYKAEVLGKLPIMQHFLFGSLLPASEDMTSASEIGNTHHHCLFDCCGIKVPSAIASSECSRGKFRHVPFD